MWSKTSFLSWNEIHLEIHNLTLINWIWWKKVLAWHFFFAPLVLEEWKLYWVLHLLFAFSLESLFCEELFRSSPLYSCIIVTKDKSNNCFIVHLKNYLHLKTYESCYLHACDVFTCSLAVSKPVLKGMFSLDSRYFSNRSCYPWNHGLL